MQNTTIEKALKNQVASVKMEGFVFSEKELENVRKCLRGELTFQQFKENILKEVKSR
ncbi:MAG: antitoxin VbhA family protein [Ruminococcus sp.]|nr:antitoxin VbhA family protein [Ruminococcus sp.]MBR6384938.1 antitoxin VbhA family protein [Ruminococcus sp.]